MAKAEYPGILFLPSGPGLSSGPAQIYLRPVFEKLGRFHFWDEPTPTRDGIVFPETEGEYWDFLVDSLEKNALDLGERVVVVTESFGSLLAEILYARLRARGLETRIVGILHTPPVVDLNWAFLSASQLAIELFFEQGDSENAAELTTMVERFIEEPTAERIDVAMTLTFGAPGLSEKFFRIPQTLQEWMGGFGQPGLAPEPDMRLRVLNGMRSRGVDRRTLLTPDVPTVVVTGGYDPYQKPSDFSEWIDKANAQPRVHPVEWKPMPTAGHYPHVDETEAWKREIWDPFFERVSKR